MQITTALITSHGATASPSPASPVIIDALLDFGPIEPCGLVTTTAAEAGFPGSDMLDVSLVLPGRGGQLVISFSGRVVELLVYFTDHRATAPSASNKRTLGRVCDLLATAYQSSPAR